MQCPICGKENHDDATYCKFCGKRMDGKKQCRFCGKLIDADAGFCNYCGTPAGTATAPLPPYGMPAYPYAAQPAYAPQPPAAHHPHAQPAHMAEAAEAPKKRARPERREGNGLFKKLTDSGTLLASLLMAVFSLIFVFLIGIQLVIPEQAIMHNNLYYYFGNAYTEIDAMLSTMEEFSGLYATSLYLSAVPMTILAALSLLGVTLLSVVGIVQDVLLLTGRREKSGSVSCFAFLTYLAASMLFLALGGGAIDPLSSSLPAGAVCTLDPVSKAGVALGSIFFGIYVLCRILPKARGLFRGNATACIASFSSAAVAIVLAALGSLSLIGIAVSSLSVGRVGEASLLTSLSSLLTTDAAVESFGAGNAAGVIALLTIVFFLHAALVLLALLAARSALFPKDPEKRGNEIKWSILLAVFSGVMLLCCIVAESLFNAGIAASGASFSLTFDYTMPVLLFGFSLVLLLVNLIRNSALPAQEKANAVPQPAPYAPYAYPPYAANAAYAEQAAPEYAVSDGTAAPADPGEEADASPSAGQASDGEQTEQTPDDEQAETAQPEPPEQTE